MKLPSILLAFTSTYLLKLLLISFTSGSFPWVFWVIALSCGFYPPLLGEDRHCKVCWLEYKLSGILKEPPLFTFVFRTSLLAFRLRAEQLALLDLLRNKDFIQLPTFISTTMYSFRGTVPMLHLSTASWIWLC